MTLDFYFGHTHKQKKKKKNHYLCSTIILVSKKRKNIYTQISIKWIILANKYKKHGNRWL